MQIVDSRHDELLEIKEAVATEFQLQCFMLLMLRSDPNGGAESGKVGVLSIDVLVLSTFGRQVLGHDRF